MLAAGEALHPVWAGREELPGTAAGTHECPHSRRYVRISIRIHRGATGVSEMLP